MKKFGFLLFAVLGLIACGDDNNDPTPEQHVTCSISAPVSYTHLDVYKRQAYRTGMDDATIRDNNNLLYTNPDNPYALPISILPEGGIYQRKDYRMLGVDFRATASWNHLFAEKHITNLFAGMEVNDLKRMQNYFQGWGMQYTIGEIPSYVYEFFKKGIESGENYYGLNHTTTRSVAAVSYTHLDVYKRQINGHFK